MAIELQVVSVTALVLSEPRERQMYEGRGDDRKSKGRVVDGSGRPLSSVSAVVLAEPIGLLPDATVQLPDSQMTGLVPGAVVRVEGGLMVRLAGGDFAAIRATVTGERIEPLGRWADWIGSAVNGKSGKAGEPRAA
jgi:hypothetical protein